MPRNTAIPGTKASSRSLRLPLSVVPGLGAAIGVSLAVLAELDDVARSRARADRMARRIVSS